MARRLGFLAYKDREGRYEYPMVMTESTLSNTQKTLVFYDDPDTGGSTKVAPCIVAGSNVRKVLMPRRKVNV